MTCNLLTLPMLDRSLPFRIKAHTHIVVQLRPVVLLFRSQLSPAISRTKWCDEGGSFPPFPAQFEHDQMRGLIRQQQRTTVCGQTVDMWEILSMPGSEITAIGRAPTSNTRATPFHSESLNFPKQNELKSLWLPRSTLKVSLLGFHWKKPEFKVCECFCWKCYYSLKNTC